MVDSLGVGFKYEDVLQLCQKATQMDMARQGMAGERGHIVEVDMGRKEEGTAVELRKGRRRKYLAEDEGAVLVQVTLQSTTKIIGGTK